MGKILKLQQLIDADACSKQVELFRSTFGDQVEVTVELALSVFDKFDWDFAARKFLSAPALAEYEKVRAAALAEYYKVMAAALAEYDKVRAAALAEYDKVRAAALAEYDKVRAAAWANLYIGE